MIANMASKGDASDQTASCKLIEEVEFARLSRLSSASLDDAVSRHIIFFVEDGDQRRFPSFFIDSRYRRSDLYRISKTLGALPGGSKLQFFVNPKGSLSGDTPLEALQRGRLAEVLRAANGFAGR